MQNRRTEAAKGRFGGFTLFHNLLLTENAAYGFRRFSTLRQPVLRPLRVDFDLRRICNGVVLTENFKEPTIARASLLDNNDPVIRTFLRPDTGQTHGYQTVCLLNPLEKPKNYIRERSQKPHISRLDLAGGADQRFQPVQSA